MEVFYADNSFNTATLITSTLDFITSISSCEKLTYTLNQNGEISAFSKQLKPSTLSLPFKVSTLSCGRDHTAVLTQQLEIFTWGNGQSGALGLSNTENFSVPQKLALSSDFNAQEVVCGGWHTVILARYSAGKNFLLMCGRNSEGQLGTGKLNRELSPVRVQIPEEITDIRAGNNFTMILTESRSIYMTGANQLGQLGIGHKKNICLFERLSIENVTQISCGNHSAALCNSKIYVWGTCSFGEYLRPTHLPGIIGAEKVYVGDSIGLAIDSEKNIWVWGGKNPEKRARKTEFKADVISLNSGMNIFAVERENLYRKKGRNQTRSFIFNNSQLVSPLFKNKVPFNEFCTSGTPKCGQTHKLRDFSTEDKNEESRISEKIQFFKEENEKLLAGSQGLTDRLNEKLKENFSLNSEIEDLQQTINQKENVIRDLKAKLRASEDSQEELYKDNKKLTEIVSVLSDEKQRLVQSDLEVKSYYEKVISELEFVRSQETKRFKEEIERLISEDYSAQEIIASLREENISLVQSKKNIEQDLGKYQQKNIMNEELIKNFEQKITLLQEQLNDMTSANHNLYKSLEKEKDSDRLVSLSQLNCKAGNDEDSEKNQESIDFTINRKGLAPQYQERMMRVAAEKMKIEDLNNEFSNYSSPGNGVDLKRHRKSFEDLKKIDMDLHKERSFVYKDIKDYKSLLKNIRK